MIKDIRNCTSKYGQKELSSHLILSTFISAVSDMHSTNNMDIKTSDLERIASAILDQTTEDSASALNKNYLTNKATNMYILENGGFIVTIQKHLCSIIDESINNRVNDGNIACISLLLSMHEFSSITNAIEMLKVIRKAAMMGDFNIDELFYISSWCLGGADILRPLLLKMCKIKGW